jgi:phosphoserine aminotransferase
MKRVYNFFSGPATLPVEVLEKAASEITDFNNTGMSIMENSHRSKTYEAVHNGAIASIRELYKVPENYDVLFLQGGACSQFHMIPMNLLKDDESADYINTGHWTDRAIKEAQILGKKIKVIASSKETNFDRIPKEFPVSKDAVYCYMASNNTIYGTQFKKFPETNGIPLIVDASSDIFSYPIDWKNVGIIYAGAQKNVGPSGVVVVIIRKDLLVDKNPTVPSMLRFSIHAKENSLFNTPPTFGIYLIGLNMQWLKSKGGVEAIQKQNEMKAGLIYSAIDESDGFYKGHAQKDSRSLMNITFKLGSEELEAKFVKESEALDLIGLKGHRSVGGIRASVYNAMPVAGCEKLADFMKKFAKSNK